MHTSRLAQVLLFIFSIGVTGFVFAAQAERGDFTFVNNTGSTVHALYLSPVKKHDWGFDRLGKKVLPDGASRVFKTPPRKTCGYDIKIVFEGNLPTTEFPNVDLCTTDKLTLQYDRKAQKVSYIKE